MHSSLVRIQNVFGFFTTVAFTVAALVAVTDIFSRQTPSASLAVQNVQVYVGLDSMDSKLIDSAGSKGAHITAHRERKILQASDSISRLVCCFEREGAVAEEQR